MKIVIPTATKNLLKPLVFPNKREVGCGIEYKTYENVLHFSGRLTHELKNDTIVIPLEGEFCSEGV